MRKQLEGIAAQQNSTQEALAQLALGCMTIARLIGLWPSDRSASHSKAADPSVSPSKAAGGADPTTGEGSSGTGAAATGESSDDSGTPAATEEEEAPGAAHDGREEDVDAPVPKWEKVCYDLGRRAERAWGRRTLPRSSSVLDLLKGKLESTKFAEFQQDA